MDVYETIVARLAMLGYAAEPVDEAEIRYNMGRCEEILKASLNADSVPRELNYVYVDMVCGYFLAARKSRGEIPGQDFSAPVKQVQEGDVSVSFAGAGDGALTPEARYDAMLDLLMHPSELILSVYRRLRW